MKHTLTLSLMFLLTFLSATGAVLDARLRTMLGKAAATGSRGEGDLTLIIGVDNMDSIQFPSGTVPGAASGNIVTVHGNAASMLELAAREEVRWMAMPSRVYLANDLARHGTGTDRIHSGESPDGLAYTGKGVMLGLFDTGFDLLNPSFRTAGDTPRIERLFHYQGPGAECREYSTPSDIDNLITESEDNTHGSHVLGTAAGYTGGRYDGMAPEASIAVGCGDLYDSNIIDGVSRIVDYAREEGKPCVVNLSLGDILGPHDGSEALPAALSELSKDAIIVMSAGNNATGNKTISKTFTTADNTLGTFIKTVGWKPDIDGYVSIWSSDERPLSLEMVIMDTWNKELWTSVNISPDLDSEPFVWATGDYGDIELPAPAVPCAAFAKAYDYGVAIVYAVRAPSGRHGYMFEFKWRASEENLYKRTAVGLRVSGETGQGADLYLQSDYAIIHGLWMDGWDNGSDVMSVSSMACGYGTVCVGSWNSRGVWTMPDGSTDSVPEDIYGDDGGVSLYSSYGLLRDGRALPHCVAPGTAVISVLSTPYHNAHPESRTPVAASAGSGRSNYWMADYGTSMASPAVAGAISLWLEADPSLNSDDVLDIIATTSYVDESIRTADPVKRGSGKFDAYAGLCEVLSRKAAIGSVEASSKMLYRRLPGGDIEVFRAGTGNFRAELYSLSGKLASAAQGEHGKATVRCSTLEPGVYILRCGADTAKVLL